MVTCGGHMYEAVKNFWLLKIIVSPDVWSLSTLRVSTQFGGFQTLLDTTYINILTSKDPIHEQVKYVSTGKCKIIVVLC